MSHFLVNQDIQILMDSVDVESMLSSDRSASSNQEEAQVAPRRHVLAPLLRRYTPEQALPVLFFLLGIGVKIPFNAFINTKEYFELRLHHPVESPFIFTFTSYMVLSMAVSLLLPRLNYPSSDIESQRNALAMVYYPLLITLTAFVVQSLLVLVDLDLPLELSMATYLCWIVTGLANSIWSAGCVALAAPFSSAVAMNPYLTGQAMAAVVIALANFGLAVVQPSPEYWNTECSNHVTPSMADESATELTVGYHQIDWSVFGFFLLATLLLLVCGIGVTCIDFFRVQLETKRKVEDKITRSVIVANKNSSGVEMLESPYHSPVGSVTSGTDQNSSFRVLPPNETSRLLMDDEQRVMVDLPAGFPSRSSSSRSSSQGNQTEQQSSVTTSISTHQLWDVFQRVKDPTMCIYITYVISIFIFPVWTSEMASTRQCQCQSQSDRLANDLFLPLSFVLFNTGDWMGRIVTSRLPFLFHWIAQRLTLLAFGRLCLVPFLLICPTIHAHPWPTLLNSDVASILLQWLFGLSHGALIATAFAYAPSTITQPQNTLMSQILTFALTFGILSGSMLSFPMSQFLV